MASSGIRRVLHVSRVGFIGGAENVLLTVACGLRSAGTESVLACPAGPLLERAGELGLTAIELPLSRMRITINPIKLSLYLRSWREYSLRLVALCRQYKIDLVHVHHPVTAIYCSKIVRRLGLPLVFHLHEGPPGRFLYKIALKQAARLATRIICVSGAGNKLLALAGADARRSTIVHNGVRDEFIRGSRVLKEPRDTNRGPRIAVIGMIEKRKAQDIFVQAASLVHEAHPDATFEIVGDTPSNDTAAFRAALTEQIEALDLSDCMKISPYREDIVDCMLSYDLIVSCSTGLESMSLVMLEAMALGRCVIASNNSGIVEVLKNGVNGFLVEPGSAESLARGILRALDGSIVDVGKAAAALAREQFTTARMCRRIEGVYCNIAQQRSLA